MFQEFLSQFAAISTKSVGIIIESMDQKSLEQYAENPRERPYAARRHAKKIKLGTGIEFSKTNEFWIYTAGLNIYWTRIGREGKEYGDFGWEDFTVIRFVLK